MPAAEAGYRATGRTGREGGPARGKFPAWRARTGRADDGDPATAIGLGQGTSDMPGPEFGRELLYLSRGSIEAVGVGMAEVIEAVALALGEKGEGRVEMPPKPGIHTRPDAFIHAMPAFVPAARAAGLKWIAGYPENLEKHRLPYITGLLILNDPETGVPLAVMDAAWITAMRTGAVSGVSAKHLARPGSRILAIFGCGAQARTQLEALALALPALAEVRCYDIVPGNRDRFVAESRNRFPSLRFVAAGGAEEAAVGADVLVTWSHSKAPLPHTAGRLAPGGHPGATDRL